MRGVRRTPADSVQICRGSGNTRAQLPASSAACRTLAAAGRLRCCIGQLDIEERHVWMKLAYRDERRYAVLSLASKSSRDRNPDIRATPRLSPSAAGPCEYREPIADEVEGGDQAAGRVNPVVRQPAVEVPGESFAGAGAGAGWLTGALHVVMPDRPPLALIGVEHTSPLRRMADVPSTRRGRRSSSASGVRNLMGACLVIPLYLFAARRALLTT